MQILMPVKDPQRLAHKSICLSRIPKNEKIPYACPSSEHVPCKSLRCSKFPTIEANPSPGKGSQQFFMPVQADDTSNANPYACTGSQKFKQFVTPVQAPNASHNSLHM
ncbi:hypothetical protein O181_025132 [Austropuccinia psidii MF-1]|uniref:Uncharacterized protein n=1 Tax=Austropuccinia psidii MF-1 TaxID=1389203 RepID=A0A9Q3CMW9_9BASI|nr:hypothetical protein [Austropuccinia psidii MF-1]